MELKTETTVSAITEKHGVQLLPGVSGTDGFYYALLQKSKDG
jgi:16S rRNA C967 or C1407 C5-methylase (RsmB/RsmF family)